MFIDTFQLELSPKAGPWITDVLLTKYSRQYHILRHFQSMLFPQAEIKFHTHTKVQVKLQFFNPYVLRVKMGRQKLLHWMLESIFTIYFALESFLTVIFYCLLSFSNIWNLPHFQGICWLPSLTREWNSHILLLDKCTSTFCTQNINLNKDQYFASSVYLTFKRYV
jgi:hypothetical protein